MRISLIPALLLAALPFLARAQNNSGDLPAANFGDIRTTGEAPAAQEGAPASPPPNAAPKPEAVDLLPQFADPSKRDQCDVGSCHAFSSVSVLEAAYYRQYGQRVHLSEADLFLQRTVLNGDVYTDFCREGTCKLSEGNDVPGDLKFAIQNGVATGIEYASFVARYERYRKAEEETMKGLQKAYEQEGWLEKLLYDPRKHWRELQTEPRAKRILESYLKGSDAKIVAERADMKAKLGGFQVDAKEFKFLGAEASKLGAGDCREKGKEQKKTLIDDLKSGQPVSVSMTLAGLKAWGQTDTSRDANHAFTLVGLESKPEGAFFKTRNSWGGDNPDVREDELCRVYLAVVIRAPKDAR